LAQVFFLGRPWPLAAMGNSLGDPFGAQQPDDTNPVAVNRVQFGAAKRENPGKVYRFRETIGQGNFGKVKLTVSKQNGEKFAVKIIPNNHPKLRTVHILGEFAMIREQDHPHICKAYEAYVTRKRVFLVLEYLAGGTLATAIDAHKAVDEPLDESDVSDYARQILGALAFLHEADLVFRDFKAENVLFTRPESKNLKLVDFGLCAQIGKGQRYLMDVAGTPYTLAPELLTAPVRYDSKCDVWSVGVVLMMCLTLEKPFVGKTTDDLFAAIRGRKLHYGQRSRWDALSDAARSFVRALLTRLPKSRPSCREALTNPFTMPWKHVDKATMREVIRRMGRWSTLHVMQKAALTALAWRLPDNETDRIRQIFEAVDGDGNGHIDLSEFADGVRKSGVTFPFGFGSLVSSLDTNHSKTIEFTELVAATMNVEHVIENDQWVDDAFKLFDQDNSGEITQQELLVILAVEKPRGGRADRIDTSRAAAYSFRDKFRVGGALAEFDASGDGMVNREEFRQMLELAAVHYSKSDGPFRCALLDNAAEKLASLTCWGGDPDARGPSAELEDSGWRLTRCTEDIFPTVASQRPSFAECDAVPTAEYDISFVWGAQSDFDAKGQPLEVALLVAKPGVAQEDGLQSARSDKDDAHHSARRRRRRHAAAAAAKLSSAHS